MLGQTKYNNAISMDSESDAPKTTEPLFLFDNDSDVEFVAPDTTQVAQSDPVQDEPADSPDVNLDAVEPPKTTGTFDLEAYQRESLARHRKDLNKTKKSIVISESPVTSGANDPKTKEKSEDRKPRQKPTKLDEGLLLSPKGFPQLIKITKDFQIKGKGHEVRLPCAADT
jgi:replication fork protection complex subunit Csm3/Swi3